MIKGYSAEQIRSVEAGRLEAGEPLMRRAAAALAAEIRRVVAGRPASTPAEDREPVRRVVVLAGSGNNGGDALFAAAELAAEGVGIVIVQVGSRLHEEGLVAALHAGARSAGDPPVGGQRVATLVEGADVVVDAILGTGAAAHPALREPAREAVTAVLPIVRQPDGPAVVAVDIPSGINPDDGTVPDPLVLPADVTVTFGGYKAGLLIAPASKLAGDVRLVDIGLATDLEKLEPAIEIDR